jgi:hypothetical protein
VVLEAAQGFGESKPASGLEFGLDAWLMAVSTRVLAQCRKLLFEKYERSLLLPPLIKVLT